MWMKKKLHPFAEATDFTQGDQYTIIGCVVPTVVCLHNLLTDSSRTNRYNNAVVKTLLESLVTRFAGIFANLKISVGASGSPTSKPFDHIYYLLAPVLDPNYGLVWLEDDHPGDDETKVAVRENIIGKLL